MPGAVTLLSNSRTEGLCPNVNFYKRSDIRSAFDNTYVFGN